jgi:hypothetical protein
MNLKSKTRAACQRRPGLFFLSPVKMKDTIIVEIEHHNSIQKASKTSSVALYSPPTDLQKLPCWLTWRAERHPGDAKDRKVPYYTNGGRRRGQQGSPEDRAALTTYAAARDAAARRGFNGVGFAPQKEFSVLATDFDNCIDAHGHLHPEVLAIVSGTYAEYSPSGKGVRAFFRGNLGDHKSPTTPTQYGFETFSEKGFVTVTGNMLPFVDLLGLEDTVADVPEVLQKLCAARWGAEPAAQDPGDENDPLATLKLRLNLTIEQMQELLEWLNPDMGRHQWIRVGMALHHETQGDDTGFELWNEWSSVGGKYQSGEDLRTQWDSFGRPRPGRRQVTMASVRKMANEEQLARGPSGQKPPSHESPADSPAPIDLWRRLDPPPLPEGLLPGPIERFARVQGELMGADPGGLAMAALTVCAATIPDSVMLQAKEHDRSWTEAPRLWVALIGTPSSKKSPIMAAAIKPLRKLNSNFMRAYKKDLAAYEKLPAEEKANQPKPVPIQLVIEDTTIEAAQMVLADNPDGVLCAQDELSGWFGAMDKYSGAKGADKDRAFWLQSWNGGSYTVNRVTRGLSHIENLSVSLLGGIQPDKIRKTIKEAQDDGLIQRLFPIVLRPSNVGKDEPTPDVALEYEALIIGLRNVKIFMFDENVLRYEPEAQEIWRQAEAHHHMLQQMEAVNPKLASHIGKYDGLLARLSVIWHCIENVGADRLPTQITKNTVERVAKFLHGFLLGHAMSFYSSVLGLSEDHEHLLDIAGYILTHNKTTMTFRDLQRGSKGMKALSRDEARKLFERLEAFGWVDLEQQPSPNTTPKWRVNPAVHRLFEARAREEKIRRERVRQVMAKLSDTKVCGGSSDTSVT